MRSRLALGPSTPAGGSGTGPNHRTILALTAPRGERRTYAETEREKEKQREEEIPRKMEIERERMRKMQNKEVFCKAGT